jgi:hypothetical protein
MNAVVNVRKHHRLNFNRLPAMAKQQIDTAQLTPMYEDAKRSLAVLARVDEVKEIYDKHTAIAHYAKQIKDNSLLYYAERVYARALARIGELIEDLSFKERKETAKIHGLSFSDAGHAINIAAIPEKAFEAYIEQTPPWSKASLSFQGSRIRSPKIRQNTLGSFSSYTKAEPVGKLQEALDHYFDNFTDESCNKLCSLEEINLISCDDATIIRKKLRPLIEYLDEMDHRLQLREAGK